MISIKFSYSQEKRRVSLEGGSTFDVLIATASKLFPSIQASSETVYFTYLDPEDGSVITLRLDEDFRECMRLFKDAPTLNLEVVCPKTETTATAATVDSDVVHTQVTCDACGQSPIVGVRFKCLVRDDFDLCATCEATSDPHQFAMVKIYQPEQAPAALLVGLKDSDSPAEGPAHWEAQPPFVAGPSSGWFGRRGPPHGPPQGPPHGHGHGFGGRRGGGFGGGGYFGGPGPRWGPPPHPTPAHAEALTPAHPTARFVRDGTYPDGAVVEKDTLFTKTWIVRNDSSVAWPSGSTLKYVSGDEMAIETPSVSAAPGEEVTVSVKLKTPPLTGRFVAYFRLAGPAGGVFGQRLWCDVRSIDPAEAEEATTAAPAPAPAPQAQAQTPSEDGTRPFARELQLLAELGFVNVEQLLPLLRDLLGNNSTGSASIEGLQRVIATLLQATSSSNAH